MQRGDIRGIPAYGHLSAFGQFAANSGNPNRCGNFTSELDK
jgi:hypothetical protein